MDTSQFVTKQDLTAFQYSIETNIDAKLEAFYIRTEKMVITVVGEVVGEIVGDALKLIAERFNQVDKCFAEVDKRFNQIDKQFKQVDKRFDRLEDKLENTVATVDHHTIDIRQLQRKTV